MDNRSFIASLVVLGIVALLGFGLIAKESDPLALGEPLPDQAFEVLGSDGKKERAVSDYLGDYVLVNLWASWCGPCRTESPALQAYYEKHRKEGFVVLGLNTEDTEDDAINFVTEYGLSYPMIRDDDRDVRDLYGSTAFPESFLINRSGRLVLEIRGPVDTQYLDRAITPVLRGKTDPLAGLGEG